MLEEETGQNMYAAEKREVGKAAQHICAQLKTRHSPPACGLWRNAFSACLLSF